MLILQKANDNVYCKRWISNLLLLMYCIKPFFFNVYVSLRLCVQNRRTKWHFPPNFRNSIIWTAPFLLNIHNGIIWGGAFPKHLGLQKHLFRYSLKMPACMIIFKILLIQKTLYIVLIFKWSHLDTNLWIWNLCICQKTCQQNTNFW